MININNQSLIYIWLLILFNIILYLAKINGIPEDVTFPTKLSEAA